MNEKYGCRLHVFFAFQKNQKMLEWVDFGGSAGGFLRTLGRVSRMEVREGTMGFPVEVRSQYLLDYIDHPVSITAVEGRGRKELTPSS
jgi:hypothetical protein